MKKVLSVVGGAILVALGCMAGVQTDKIVFGDDTEMTTAAAGGSPPATNTTTTTFEQTLTVPELQGASTSGLTVSGAGTSAVNQDYVEQDGLVDGEPWYQSDDGLYNIFYNDAVGTDWLLDLASNGTSGGSPPLYDYSGASPIATWSAVWEGDAPAPTVSDNPEPAKSIDLDAGTFSYDATTGQEIVNYQTMAGMGYGDAYLASNQTWTGANTYDTDSIQTFTYTGFDYCRMDGANYYVEFPFESSATMWGAANDVRIYYDGTDLVIDSMDVTANDEVEFTDFDAVNVENKLAIKEGANAVATLEAYTAIFTIKDASAGTRLQFADSSYMTIGERGMFVDGEVAGLDVYMGVDEATDFALRTEGDVNFDSDVVVEMDDAEGTGTSWQEWAIGGAQDTDENWRMGVVNSNFVVQVRVSGVWTNATAFQRP